MSLHYHVSSSLNRASIERFGLDWNHMGAARGIAGSNRPEQQGCFLTAHESESEYFVRMNNTGGPVDVWEVSGIDHAELVVSPEGYQYFPGIISASALRLIRRDVQPE